MNLHHPRRFLLALLGTFALLGFSCGSPECESDDDCSNKPGLAGPCAVAACRSEKCISAPAAAGAVCDDGLACTGPDVCDGAGSCAGGPPLSCDDSNACTRDDCSPQFGCVHQAQAGACDDGDPCTANDRCQAGACAGEADPGCGRPFCGDGTCAADESCADCSEDCSPVGMGECSGSCDPTAETTACAAGFACVPTRDGALNPDPFRLGDGVCGRGCATEVECAGGESCVRVEGLETAGLCARECTGDADCDGALTCVPSAAGGGRCLPGAGCDPATPSALCLAAATLQQGGFAPTTCFARATNACAGDLSCVGRSDAALHEGTCVGQATPCDPALQSGCSPHETCRPLGGPAILGRATFCDARSGPGEEEATCASGGDCQEGLACDLDQACRPYCKPGAVGACGGGFCADRGAETGFPAGTVGVCGPGCGDATCALDETCLSCPDDCGPCEFCGDGRCAADERCESCEEDCGPCPACGDERCDPLEDCTSCPSDCGCPYCGDGVCDGETCRDCADDCGACTATCANGVCEVGEDCSTCAQDCGLAGLPACTGSCDPLGTPTGCGTDAACMPTADGQAFLVAFQVGNGVCASGCAEDGECGAGNRCLRLAGLAIDGVCGPECTPGTGDGCADGHCFPLTEGGTVGACLVGPECDPTVPSCNEPARRACVGLAGNANTGVCLEGCFAQDVAACGGAGCQARTDLAWHTGMCVGQSPACEPIAGTGCLSGESCAVLGGLAFGGTARLCLPAGGAGIAGDPCQDTTSCQDGLICHEAYCRAWCQPGTVCADGPCSDLSTVFYLPTGTLGLCL
ncbi:MAG: hypothetical protein HY901_05280 [Deltaproteobacteria bacterium]|nr:hypothetical protein [Deltaproteobacteria bacterium]